MALSKKQIRMLTLMEFAEKYLSMEEIFFEALYEFLKKIGIPEEVLDFVYYPIDQKFFWLNKLLQLADAIIDDFCLDLEKK